MNDRQSTTAAMIRSAREAMIHVLGMVAQDSVLVVADPAQERIGEAFAAAAREVGCAAETYLLPEAERPLTEVPDAMTAALAGKTIVINCFGSMAEETPFRIKWIFAIGATRRVRLGHAPGITEAMMTSGPMNVDYAEMRETARRLIAAFAGAESVHITAPGGTDLVLGISGRDWLSDVRATVEAGCNLPCGEIYCAPEETRADGVLVVDGTIGDVDLTRALKITLTGGRLTGLESEDEELVAEVRKLTSIDADASVIGELGIGLNPGAKLTGNMLEDEKAFKTAHIAFGNNTEFPGGRNRSATHRDFLFHKPTLRVRFTDGSERILIEKGEFPAGGPL